MNHLFTFCSAFAVTGWLLLIFLPRWRWTERLILSGFWSLLLSAVYLILILLFMPAADGGFGSIAEVRTLFANDALLLAGWIHYLAFDLMVGALEVKQAREVGIPHFRMVPVLIFTFLLGPVGLILFFFLKSTQQKKLTEVT